MKSHDHDDRDCPQALDVAALVGWLLHAGGPWVGCLCRCLDLVAGVRVVDALVGPSWFIVNSVVWEAFERAWFSPHMGVYLAVRTRRWCQTSTPSN